MTRVLILGAGGYGRLVQDALHTNPDVAVAGFLDPDRTLHGQLVNGTPVLGDDDLLPALLADGMVGVVAAVGNNHRRAELFDRIAALGFAPINVIHPRAVIGSHVRLGRGVVVLAGAVINVNSCIGDDVIINTGATVDHDNVLEDHSQIWPGASLAGNVTVRAYAYVGTKAAVIPGITIGRNSIVGAGAAVIADVPDNVVAVGVPARVIKTRT